MQKLLGKTQAQEKNRIYSGVPGFDNLVFGGFRQNSVNVIIADPGCGKSTFCWQYCSHDVNSPALYVSLEQTLDSVLRDCNDIGLYNFEKKYKKGNLQFQVAFSEDSDMTSGEIGLRFFMAELPKYLDVIRETADKYRARANRLGKRNSKA